MVSKSNFEMARVNLQYEHTMGVGKIFSRRGTRGFFQNFSRGTKSGEICFFPLKTKKTTFFCYEFQNPIGVKAHLPPPSPTPMEHTHMVMPDNKHFFFLI